MEDIYQVYVKFLNGKHRALNFTSPSITVLSVKHRLFDLTGIPIADQRIVSGTGHLTDQSFLSPAADGPHSFPILHLLLRLPGGKGGFGSLLRGAGTKAGQKKTNNFDACRDMSGRRLRHVNAEKELEEWKAEAEERRLEKAAEEFLRKKMKAEGRHSKEGGGAETEKYVMKYMEDSARCMEEVEKSVRETLGKKRMNSGQTMALDAKKLKIWMGKKKAGSSDSDDSGDEEKEEDDNSVVLDNGNDSGSSKQAKGSSGSVNGGEINGNSIAGGPSETSLDEDEETAVRGTSVNGERSGGATVGDMVEQNGGVSLTDVVSEPETTKAGEKLKFNDSEACSLKGTVGQPLVTSNSVEGDVTTTAAATKAMIASVADFGKLLNFDKFNSSAELVAFGSEKLKFELQSRGLKCGGTLQERAARLFLLKTTPLEKIPKKLFAKK